MRAYQDVRNVAVSENDIRTFCAQWPASGLRDLKGVTFQFAKNGDLVDIWYKNGNSDRWDGSALTALSHDAQAYLKASKSPAARAAALAEFRAAKHFPWWWPESWGGMKDTKRSPRSR